MKLVNNLIKIRKNLKLSREEVARIAGISYSAYSDIETSRTIPKLTTALKISRVLKVTVDKLFKLDIWGDDSQKKHKRISNLS